jgi:hypothetical protein
MTLAPRTVYTSNSSEPLTGLRDLIGWLPEAISGDPRELTLLLRCPEFEVEEARRWLLEDGLEVQA